MKKIYLLFSSLFVVLIISIYFVYWPKTRLDLAVEAAGGFPYQMGLSSLAEIPCVTVGTPPVCSGGKTCVTKDVATCTSYSEIFGTPSGGMGDTGLFLKTNLALAGVTSGGQMIAGGMSPVLMDSGVIAGIGGCAGSGCTAINDKNIFERYYEIAKYAIAKIKD